MSDNTIFLEVFDQLKAILQPYADQLVCKHSSSEHFYLDTAYIMKNKKPLFFGAVKINKHYVSYHLMPVYVQPELLDGISDALRARMQGKSCFNFKQIDDGLFMELKKLTELGFDSYREQAYL